MPVHATVDRLALVLIDVQRGFEDAEYWGPRNNPDCEANIAALLGTWQAYSRPVVCVRHDSPQPASPLGQPGNDLKPLMRGQPDLLVTKSVNSALHGAPDLDAWLRAEQLRGLVVAGITTNHCCETTARVGANSAMRSCSHSTRPTPSTVADPTVASCRRTSSLESPQRIFTTSSPRS